MPALRNKSKYSGIKGTLYSAKYAMEGLIYAYKTEKSLLIHAFLSFISITAGFIFKISLNQWRVLFITLAVVLAFELVNTAMEACVDMVTVEYNELAKIAKDCCGAATFVTTIVGIVIALSIFGPKFLILFS